MENYLSIFVYCFTFILFFTSLKYINVFSVNRIIAWVERWHELYSPRNNYIFSSIFKLFLLLKIENINIQQISTFILKNKKNLKEKNLTELLEITFSYNARSIKKNNVIYIGLISIMTLAFILNNILLIFFNTNVTLSLMFDFSYINFLFYIIDFFKNYKKQTNKNRYNDLCSLNTIYQRIHYHLDKHSDLNILKSLDALSERFPLNTPEIVNYVELLMLYAIKNDFSNIDVSTQNLINHLNELNQLNIDNTTTWVDNLIQMKEQNV